MRWDEGSGDAGGGGGGEDEKRGGKPFFCPKTDSFLEERASVEKKPITARAGTSAPLGNPGGSSALCAGVCSYPALRSSSRSPYIPERRRRRNTACCKRPGDYRRAAYGAGGSAGSAD